LAESEEWCGVLFVCSNTAFQYGILFSIPEVPLCLGWDLAQFDMHLLNLAFVKQCNLIGSDSSLRDKASAKVRQQSPYSFYCTVQSVDIYLLQFFELVVIFVFLYSVA
jgi:hypothetical protein